MKNPSVLLAVLVCLGASTLGQAPATTEPLGPVRHSPQRHGTTNARL